MSEFLDSLKADLLDRRMRPLLALVGVALLAALGYAVLGGGGSSSTTPSASTSLPPVSLGAPGIPISQAPTTPNPNQALAETTSGSAQQLGGPSRDPFVPLGGTLKTSAASTATSTSATAGSKASGSGSTTASSPESSASSKTSTETTPAAPSKPTPAKPQTVYDVAIQFGPIPPGLTAASAQLTPYTKLKRQTPLPSAKQPIIVFRGVTAGGKSATFTLVGEAILRGVAKCLPSTSQCQAIELKSGQSEEFEYLPPTGAAVTYLLQLVEISSMQATAAAARTAFRGESTAGRQLLKRIGLLALPGMHYSAAKGVLVLAARPAVAAHAHTAPASAHRWHLVGISPSLR
jgi:hypothetical protein